MVLSGVKRQVQDEYLWRDGRDEPLTFVLTGRELDLILTGLARIATGKGDNMHKQLARAVDKKLYLQLEGHMLVNGWRDRIELAEGTVIIKNTGEVTAYSGEAGQWHKVE